MSVDLPSDEIVVGEAVAVEVGRAGLGRRILGGILDVVVQITLLSALFALVYVGLADSLDDDLFFVATIVLMVGTLVGWPVAWETATNGRSVGKFASGERVVRVDGGSITFRHSLIRALIGWVEIWLTSGSLATCAILFSRRSQRFGDMAAGTMVVLNKVPLHIPAPAQMPPYLDRWAASADIRTLDPVLAITIRQFLIRRTQLSPSARERLAERLCVRTATHVSPLPPPCHPEDFLLAVIAERGRRDRRRLAAASELSDRLLGGRSVPQGSISWVGAQSPSQPVHR